MYCTLPIAIVPYSYCYICTVYILKIHEQPYSRGCILVVNKLALEVVGREFEPRLSQDLI